MLSNTENFQATQVESSNLDRFYVSNPLQNSLSHLNPFQKQDYLFQELYKAGDKLCRSAETVASYLIRKINNTTNLAYHTRKTIARETRLSINTVKFALKKLKASGFIITEQRSPTYKGRWNSNVTQFTCLIPTVGSLEYPHTTLEKKKVSTTLKKDNTNFAKQVEEQKTSHSEKPNNSKMFELTMDWSATIHTINNLEKLGLTYENRESEKRSFILHTLKQSGGKRFLTKKQANAMYYFFCKTTLEKKRAIEAQGKEWYSFEKRRNMSEEKLYTQPITTLPPPDTPVEDQIDEEQAMQLKNLFSHKKAFKPPTNTSWQAQAAQELSRRPDDDLLDQLFEEQKRAGMLRN